MKINELFNELKEKECYTSFILENADAFLTTGFFLLAREEKEGDSLQLDFYLPKEEKMVSFEYPFTQSKKHDDIITDCVPLHVENLSVDLDTVRDVVEAEFKKEFGKIILVFQRGVWNVTAIDGVDLKRCKIEAASGEILESGNLSLNDVVRIKK
ncbi:MAG: hypothetical protein ACI86P_002462 [Flavobacteriales bacterium]|jgi:hypothetical protein